MTMLTAIRVLWNSEANHDMGRFGYKYYQHTASGGEQPLHAALIVPYTIGYQQSSCARQVDGHWCAEFEESEAYRLVANYPLDCFGHQLNPTSPIVSSPACAIGICLFALGTILFSSTPSRRTTTKLL